MGRLAYRLSVRLKKLVRRGTVVMGSVLHQLMTPVFNLAVSFLVIRLASDVLWGQFVALLIVVQLAAQLAAWGNHTYLLRTFSQHPDRINTTWANSLVSRLGLALALCALLPLLGYSLTITLGSIVWLLSMMLAGSFGVFVTYRRAFPFSLGVEAAATALMLFVIFALGDGITITTLTLLFAITYLFKLVFYSLRFWDHVQALRDARLDVRYFRAAAPFFLLGFSGMLASRVDLYAVSALRPSPEVAQYQVFINLMLYLQALSQFIVLPYVKGLYRLPDSSIFRAAVGLFVLGATLLIPGLLISHSLLEWLYGFEYMTDFMLLGGAFVLPIYGHIALIHRLYRQDRQHIVLWVNVAGIFINLLLNLPLITVMGIKGALLASAVVQWAMLSYYIWEARRAYVPAVSGMPSGD